MQGNIHWPQGLFFNFTRVIFYHNHGHVLFYKKADKDNPCDKLIVLLAIIYTHHVLFSRHYFSSKSVLLPCCVTENPT